jgi:hypothetical protein
MGVWAARAATPRAVRPKKFPGRGTDRVPSIASHPTGARRFARASLSRKAPRGRVRGPRGVSRILLPCRSAVGDGPHHRRGDRGAVPLGRCPDFRQRQESRVIKASRSPPAGSGVDVVGDTGNITGHGGMKGRRTARSEAAKRNTAKSAQAHFRGGPAAPYRSAYKGGRQYQPHGRQRSAPAELPRQCRHLVDARDTTTFPGMSWFKPRL